MKQNIKSFVLIQIFLIMITNSVFCQNVPKDNFTLYPESIMRLALDNSSRIEAAKHKLKSAKYNFNLFESEFTQFTPLIMNSEILGNKGNEYGSETSIGIQKEFFDGSSISASLGNSNFWGESLSDENIQFIKTEVQFPLFSSNRKLNRIIKRTFEENELFGAQLDYVNTIRSTIRNALEMYYDYVPRAKTLERLKMYEKNLIKLKNHEKLSGRLLEQQQLEGEINSLISKIQGWEIEVQSLAIEMERWISIKNFKNYIIKSIDLDFTNENYFGEYYVLASHDEILQKAIQNDTELRVLELIKKNATEKKRLAEKGKWDIFLSIGGQYNYRDNINSIDYTPFYKAGAGLEIKRFDRAVLNNTIQKADADIRHIETTMEDRRIEMASEITQKKTTLMITKEQILSSRTSLYSWEQIYDIKMDNFINGAETVDNYIQVFRSLINTMEENLAYENEYLDTVRDFDYIRGVYFKFLGIDAY